MESENNISYIPESDQTPQVQKLPFYKRKILIIVLSLFIIVLSFILTIFFLNPKKSENVSVVTPTPFKQNLQQNIQTWEIDVLYNSQDGSFVVQGLTLKKNGQVQNFENINSPYSISIEDESKNIIYTSKVPIATNLVVPEKFIGTPLEQQLKREPLQSSFQVPYFENAMSFYISKKEGKILKIDFPEDISSEVNFIQQAGNTGSGNSDSTMVFSENNSPGWSLSATPICENGKAFIKYEYSTTTPAVLFTIDTDIKNGLGINAFDDDSWEARGPGLNLIGGNGEYIAKANRILWTYPAMPFDQYNGPVGFLKGHEYIGQIETSGDWTCDERGDSSGVGCVEGDVPEFGMAYVNVTTLDKDECPDNAKDVSEPKKAGELEYKCVPDEECSGSTGALQICTFKCGYKGGDGR